MIRKYFLIAHIVYEENGHSDCTLIVEINRSLMEGYVIPENIMPLLSGSIKKTKNTKELRRDIVYIFKIIYVIPYIIIWQIFQEIQCYSTRNIIHYVSVVNKSPMTFFSRNNS